MPILVFLKLIKKSEKKRRVNIIRRRNRTRNTFGIKEALHRQNKNSENQQDKIKQIQT